MANQKTQAPARRMVGAYIPESVSTFLALYSICVDKPKSRIIRDLLSQWKETNVYSEQLMLDTITEKIQSKWYGQKYEDDSKTPQNIDEHFIKYLNQHRQSLLGKMLPEQKVSQIIDRIKK